MASEFLGFIGSVSINFRPSFRFAISNSCKDERKLESVFLKEAYFNGHASRL